MSIVLSIYSQKGFREVTLPERGQNELRVLIRKDLFDLNGDLTLTLEKTGDEWKLTPTGGALLMNGKRYRSAPIGGGMQLEVETRGGKRVTVLTAERNSPFEAYRKYGLAGLQRILIGRSQNADVSYHYDFVSGEHCIITLKNGGAELRDVSRNGTYVNFQRVYGNTILKYGDSIRIMRLNIIYLGSMLAINDCDGLRVTIPRVEGADRINALATPAKGGRGDKILFHRSPRNLRAINVDPIEIEPPPQQQEYQDQPLAMQVGPALTMAVPMMLGSGLSVLGNNSGSSMMMYMGMVTALSSALIGAFWAVANVRYAAKTRRQAENRRFESYSEYLIRMRDRIERQYNANADALRERSLSADECCNLNGESPLLWNRNDSYEDFLAVRLGMGDLPFQAPVLIPKERFTLMNDSLADKPRLLQENFKMLKNVPVSVDLLKNRVVGVAGGENRKSAISIAQAMIAQIAASNCYTDVKIAIVCDESSDIDRNAWDFAMWLPHVWSGDKKIRYMATNRSERGDVFYALTQILRNRDEEKAQKLSLKPRIILFVSDPVLLDGEAIAHYVFDRNEDLGLSTVLLAGKPEELPNECECVVECDSQFRGLYDTRSGRANGTQVNFDQVSQERLWKFAKSLGRIEVVDSDQEGEIPNSLTFFDMFGVERPEELDAPNRWQKSDVISSMRALVGFRSGNIPCYLDINEKYHGPHGLVAGTTGSGKSETLQTYILSLAVNYSPEDVGFFIIDYKGGGMANLFDNLPHMIGSISNLSGNQVKRAMVSIQSENRRRQRIFTEYGVNSINGYTALYKNGDAKEPVPHLFIIIDEFAELKREEPEFMKELISVAQVGRSLGVHMILSTQRPSGTVDENIWANSKFRLCLRVQDRQDSMDMLHRVEAAYLTQAGRCYLQVGNDEIFELFQSGWSGASYDEGMGGSLLIAQMLSVTGKVDLAGNRAKIKRKEATRRLWLKQLIDALKKTEKETGLSASESGFDFTSASNQDFRGAFYKILHEIQPEFEESDFNNNRVQDFIALYQETAEEPDASRIDRIIEMASASGDRRLPEPRTKTQLEVTADYLRAVSRDMGIKKIRKLWMPVLPTHLYLDAMEIFRRAAFDGQNWPESPSRFRLNAVIGMADDPANQAQFPVSLDFARGGNHLLTGTVSAGKSTFVQSVVYSLISAYPPDLLNIYCLDFSAKMLSVFQDAPHVGGYLDESGLDTDVIAKFFTLMSRILDERKKMFAGTSFADSMNHNGWNQPAILIVIDNYGAFREKTNEIYDAQMAQIVKEGNAYGIYLLVTAASISMQEMPSRLAENFRTGLSLEMPDPFAYGEVLHIMKPDVLPEARVRGRGLMLHDGRILEFQTALAAPTRGGQIGKEANGGDIMIEAPERNERIKAAVQRMKAVWKKPQARKIPTLPKDLSRKAFVALPEYQDALRNHDLMPVGYDFSDASVYSLDLRKNFSWIISGTRQSGKSVFMRNIMFACSERDPQSVHIIEIGSQQFKGLAEANGWNRYDDIYSLAEFFDWIWLEIIKNRNPLKGNCRARNASRDELFDESQVNSRINLFIATPLALAEELSKIDEIAPVTVESPAEKADKAENGASAESVSIENAETKQAEDGASAESVSIENAETKQAENGASVESVSIENAEAKQAENGASAESANMESAKRELKVPRAVQLERFQTLCERGEGFNLFIYTEVSDRDLDNNLAGNAWFEYLASYQSGIRFGGQFGKQSILPFANVDYRNQDRSMKPGNGLMPTDKPEDRQIRVVVPNT